MRISTNNYFKRKFEAYRGDMKNTWRNIKYLIKAKTNCRAISMLNYKGNKITQPVKIAEAFGEYFASVASDLAKTIHGVRNVTPFDYFVNPAVSSFFFVSPATNDEVAAVINAFPTNGGYIKWTPIYIYKKLSALLSKDINELFNSSVTEGILPSSLKLAKIIPIFKAGN